MERYEAGDRVTVEELIASAERGVEVELTRDGMVVARVIPMPEHGSANRGAQGDWLEDLKRLHASLPPDWPRTGWQETLREARDEDPF